MGAWRNIRVVLFAFVVLPACKKNTPQNHNTNITNNAETYFSVQQFILDQWEVFKGQPFTFEKRIVNGDQADTGIITAQDVDWALIFKSFRAADISDTSFLNKYKFSVFDENLSGTSNLYYEATNPDVFTRVFQITIDPVNNKIRAIYIETEKKSFWGTTKQKLYYAPLKTIQIQEFEDPLIGSDKKRIISYRFMS